MIDSGTTKLFRPTRKDSARYSMLFHKITGIQIKPTTTGPPLRSFVWSTEMHNYYPCYLFSKCKTMQICKEMVWRSCLASFSSPDFYIMDNWSRWYSYRTQVQWLNFGQNIGGEGWRMLGGGCWWKCVYWGQSCFWSGVRQNAHLHPRDEGKELPRKLKLVLINWALANGQCRTIWQMAN